MGHSWRIHLVSELGADDVCHTDADSVHSEKQRRSDSPSRTCSSTEQGSGEVKKTLLPAQEIIFVHVLIIQLYLNLQSWLRFQDHLEGGRGGGRRRA